MNYTKIAIMNSLWELLEEKPYNKITVNDIANRCKINRNTFYYHFQDIQELLTFILETAAEEVLKKHVPFDSPMDCIKPIVHLVLENQKPIMNIYHSLQRNIFIHRLDQIALQVTEDYMIRHENLSLQDEKEKTVIIRFYKCIIVGVTLDWLESDLSYDLSLYLEEVFTHFKEGKSKRLLD